MRKLLLASAAMLGATSGLALAQAPTPAAAGMMMQPSQGQMALPWSQGPTADNNNNSYGSPSTYAGGAAYGANARPTPGTVVIRLNGKVEFDADAYWTTGNNSETPGFKVNPVAFGVYMRLYPGVDGMAANGLRYGASIELRENFPGSAAQPTPALGSAAAAPGAVGGAAPSGSGYSSGETVYVRRAFTYLANDNVGVVRFGQADGVIGLFDPCIFSAQCWDAGIGNFNGGQMQGQAPAAGSAIPFVVLAQAGAEYGNTKVVYLSPQFAGLDFGVQYAPGMNNGFSACGGGAQAGFGCSTTTTGNDPTRWYNQVAVGARWQGTFGPVGLGAYAVYETAGKESYFGPAINSGGAAHTAGNRYDNLSFVSAAAYATLTTGIGSITYSFDYIGGALNGQLAMRPTGGVPEQGGVTGLLYKNGPLTLGAEALLVNSQGAAQLTGISQRHEFEVAFGGNYNLAPGLYLVGEYMYEYRHQGGYDFNTGATAPGTATHDGRGQALMFSTVVNW
jgi:hypothetical protein